MLSPLPSYDSDSHGSTFEDVPGPSKECKIGALWPGEKHSEASSFLKDLAEDLFGAQDDRDRSDEVEQKASGIKQSSKAAKNRRNKIRKKAKLSRAMEKDPSLIH